MPGAEHVYLANSYRYLKHTSNYIPEGSRGYYVVGLDAASAASAADLVVLALARTGINFFF